VLCREQRRAQRQSDVRGFELNEPHGSSEKRKAAQSSVGASISLTLAQHKFTLGPNCDPGGSAKTVKIIT
jgi:hypothetical protein